MTLIQEALRRAEKALAGDSNDAEHDALYALVEAVKVALPWAKEEPDVWKRNGTNTCGSRVPVWRKEDL